MYGAHFVDDALKEALDGICRKRAMVVGNHILKYLVFAFGFVNRQIEMLLDAADLLDDTCALVQQIKQPEIYFINPIAAAGQGLKCKLAHSFYLKKQNARRSLEWTRAQGEAEW